MMLPDSAKPDVALHLLPPATWSSRTTSQLVLVVIASATILNILHRHNSLTRFSSSSPPPPLSYPCLPPEMGIGGAGWRRGPVIGRGSSATVSLAAASDSGELFAVKSAELSRSAVLRREQRILSSLDSPHVVSCFGFDVDGLSFNLFMEYAPRGSLSDEIARRGGRLDEAAIRSYAGEILRGLAYLHSRGVAHCDVKGRNVLIGSDGRSKIADLGCARLLREDGCGGRQCLRGTPMFMAPEVARGEEQGPAADLWALGCTVIEMATGGPPWPDVSDPIGAIHRVGFSPAAVPDFPGWLSAKGKDFLGKCLRRDPRERWTADQLLGHEFVASPPVNYPPKQDADRHWVSPKSTLDRGFWESLPCSEQSVQPSSCDPSARIQDLIADTDGGDPNWTWDESWVTIRSSGEECAGAGAGASISPAGSETAEGWSRDHQFYAEIASAVRGNSDGCDERIVTARCRDEFDKVSGNRNIQFLVSYWLLFLHSCCLLTFVFTLLFLRFPSFPKTSVCLSTSFVPLEEASSIPSCFLFNNLTQADPIWAHDVTIKLALRDKKP